MRPARPDFTANANGGYRPPPLLVPPLLVPPLFEPAPLEPALFEPPLLEGFVGAIV